MCFGRKYSSSENPLEPYWIILKDTEKSCTGISSYIEDSMSCKEITG